MEVLVQIGYIPTRQSVQMPEGGCEIETGLQLGGDEKFRNQILEYLQMLTNDTLDYARNQDIHYVWIVQYNEPGDKIAGTYLLRSLIDSGRKAVLITPNGGPATMPEGNNTKALDEGTPVNAIINFNLRYLSFYASLTKDKVIGGVTDPQIILAHELIHAYHMTGGTFALTQSFRIDSNLLYNGIVPKYELQAMGIDQYSGNLFTENRIRGEQYQYGYYGLLRYEY